jgi:hypothetical protein
LENIISINPKETENYKLYKELYSLIPRKFSSIAFTYSYNRDGVKKDSELFNNNRAITKNYDISKHELKEIILLGESLYSRYKEYFGTFLDKNIIYKAPLEMIIVLSYYIKIINSKHKKYNT